MKVSEELHIELTKIAHHTHMDGRGDWRKTVSRVIACIPEPPGESEPPTKEEVEYALRVFFVERGETSYERMNNVLRKFTERRSNQVRAAMGAYSAVKSKLRVYASEFPFNSEGKPDVDNILENIRKLKAERNELDVKLAELRSCHKDMVRLQDVKRAVVRVESNFSIRISAQERIDEILKELLRKPKTAAERVSVVGPTGSVVDFAVFVDGVPECGGFESRVYANRYASGRIAELEKEQEGNKGAN